MIKKATIGVFILAIGLCIAYAAGPRPKFESVDNTPLAKSYTLSELNRIISDRESVVQYLKDDNEARIIWADSIPTRTEYSIVYLHGFSASQGEGFPMHLNIADSLKANLFLVRLPEHGISNKDAMKNLTPSMLVEASKDAIAIGKSIGEKVIVMGCSTGGTLGIFLTAGDPEIHGLVLISPNIEVRSSGSQLLTGPWGKELAYQLVGEHRILNQDDQTRKYWSHHYHTNGVIAMQSLLDQTMSNEVFQEIAVPVYCAYYYKNEEIQDPIVSVEAMLDFKNQLRLPPDDIEFEAFSKGSHVLSSVYKNEDWHHVKNEILDFILKEL